MSVYDHLEYRHLKYVIAVAETGSINGAAARLFVSQSAISEQIRAIEDILEIQIFVSKSGGCKLTAEGKGLLSFAYLALDDRRHVIQTLQAIRAESLKPLRLGFSPFIEKELLQTVKETYRNLLPGCEIQLENAGTNELVLQVHSDSLDAAMTLPVDRDGLQVKLLERERLVVCLRSDDPLAGNVAIVPSALNGKLSIFDYQRYHPAAYARIVEMLRELGITPRPSAPTMNSEHIQWMVKEGMGYALVRANRPLAEGLVSRPIAGISWTIDSALIAKTGEQHPTLLLLVHELAKRSPAEPEMPPKKQPATARIRVSAKHGAEDQMALFSTGKLPEHRLKQERVSV